MARRLAIIVAIRTCTCIATTPAAQSGSTNWDAKFRALPEASNIRASMQRLSARPHHVGSAYDKDNAEWILQRFKDWGWDAQIETFSVLFPTPKERLLELVAPTRFTAKLEEPAVPGDPTWCGRALNRCIEARMFDASGSSRNFASQFVEPDCAAGVVAKQVHVLIATMMANRRAMVSSCLAILPATGGR